MKRPRFSACMLILVFTLVWGIALTHKYLSFGYFDWDLAFFNQAMWNMLHGSMHVSLFNVNFFSNHANLIALFFLPIYGLFPHPLSLIYIKILFFSGAAYPVFLLAREKLGFRWGIFFILVYFLYPPLNYGMSYEFDWESISVFFIIWIFYFYHRKNFRLFCLFSVFLLLIKENMPGYIFALGVHALITRREKRWIWVPLVASVAWFFFAAFVFVPYFFNSHKQPYPYFTNNYSVIARTPVRIPEILFSRSNRDFLIQFLGPLVFLPVLRPDILLLAGPFLLQHMLSQVPAEHSVYFNYSFSLAPFFILAAIWGVKSLAAIPLPKKSAAFNKTFSFLLALMMMEFALVSAGRFWPSFIGLLRWRPDAITERRWGLLRQIPRESPVLASFIFLPELSSRKELFPLHDVYNNCHFRKSGENNKTGYALIDFNDYFLAEGLAEDPANYAKLADFFAASGFKAVESVNDTVLFKKNYALGFNLFEENGHPLTRSDRAIDVGNSLRLSVDALPAVNQKDGLLSLKFYWRCLKKTGVNYDMLLAFTKNTGKAGHVTVHPVCYRMRPVSLWQENEIIEENYNLLVPDLGEGRYYLWVLLYDARSATGPDLASGSLKVSSNKKAAKIGEFDFKRGR